MKFQPTRGIVFLKAISEIQEKDKQSTGYGIKGDKRAPEEMYKWEVVAVGGGYPSRYGMVIESPVQLGDTVSIHAHNATVREKLDAAGFLLDGQLYLPVEFEEVLGTWDGEAT